MKIDSVIKASAEEREKLLKETKRFNEQRTAAWGNLEPPFFVRLLDFSLAF